MTQAREKFETRKLPMMPIRDVVIFPHMMTPFVVGRESSVRALEEALAGDRKIFLATQHDASVDEPKPNEIYQVGTIVNIVQSLKLPDGNIKVLVEGVERGKILQVVDTDGFFHASVRVAKYTVEATPVIEQAMQRVTSLFEQYVKLCQSLNYETMIAAVRMEDPSKLTDVIAANMQLSIEEKQELLEIFDPAERLNRVADVLEIEIEKLNMDRTIQTRVKRQMERAQKEYYLNEKIKAIQKELGRGEKSEWDELKKKVDSAGMPKEVHEKALQELKKLEAMPPMSAESTVSRNYLDWLLAVPQEIERDSQHRVGGEDPQRRPLWAGKNQGSHPRISRSAPIGKESQRLDTLLRRTSWCWQDIAGHVDREGHWTQIRSPLTRWRTRRSRDSWTSPHLHRRSTRTDHPVDEEGRHQEPGHHARRNRQDGC